ncbi:PIG-L family deacetylase [Flavihumibacter petaseus]|uniref:Hydrolase n=1 Tax=Flavihumibacter petaseus NBRC 106054 TaxID=1220578 RepID=A0A0E9MZL3_9BACT|nr:PIG-L family deacetylase [Flavihumibacter petaseus]GAO42958.1 hypothetical protein FPE01S_02_00630 [Flavihumibacter petaseus NBRC 106054]
MRSSKLFFALLGSLLVVSRSFGQAPPVTSSADILLQLQKLKVLGSVLYVAAHPDDENTRLLAYLARDKKYRTGYLSLTRGDGGQNLIGDEQGVSLGLIRTQELLAARRIDGAEQFFSRAYDFGFSKSTEEALRIWKKDKILSDVVWIIRKFQPDVIITRFPPDARAGHGHHSASAALAIEAFRAAADPKMFPEQLQFVQPWQAKRIFWNTFNFGSVNTQSENQFKLDVGGFNPLVGKSYGEIAAESRSQHKSQGFGVPRQRGVSFEYFSLTGGDSVKTDLLEGVATDWSRTGNADLNPMVDKVIANYNPLQPSAIVPDLLTLRTAINERSSNAAKYWVQQKTKEIDALVKACLGMYAEAVTNQQVAVTGDSLQITINVVNRGPLPVTGVKIQYQDTSFVVAPTAVNNQLFTVVIRRPVFDDFMADQPYWLREQMDTGSFTVHTPLLIGYPQNPVRGLQVGYTIDRTYFTEELPLQYKFTDPVKGEIYQPVFAVPPIVVGSLPPVILNNLVPKHKQQIEVSYKSYMQKDAAKGTIRFEMIGNKGAKDKNLPVDMAFNKNQLQRYNISFDSLFSKEKPQQIYPYIEVKDSSKVKRYNNAMKLIQYDHIPTVHYFFPNNIRVINEEIRTVGKLIGYIPGSGDGIPEALKQMGFTVENLDEGALASVDLGRYDAIITGVRAYNVKESLNNNYDRLMRYVSEGGNLIVQYNTSSQIGPVKAKIGPYPFNISRTRVTDEKAAVTILDANSPILNYPNKIGPADFDGWIQERSIYHAAGWDSHYQPLFSMHDAGEDADSGSLIYTRYGKGFFTYTGIVFFRELPAGVPGAYRLLANLIALNQKKGF